MKKVNEIKRSLLSRELDASLAVLCCGEERLSPYRERLCAVCDGFLEKFGNAGGAGIFSAPGRTELGGNHTDHQHGRVLTASVDIDAVCCAAPNGTEKIRIFSDGYGMISVDISQSGPMTGEKNTSAAIVRGVAIEIKKLGFPVSGFDAFVSSAVPGGSGLSSSACFEVLLGTAVNSLFCGGKLENIDIAKIGQRAENEYFGKPSGLLDQMGCAVGGIVAIDFRSEPVCEKLDFSFNEAGYAVVMVDSGADHAGLTEEYAAITRELGEVCALFGKRYLREVAKEDFYSRFAEVREKAGDRAALRAVHIYDENRRVKLQTEALRNGDTAAFFELVRQSGISSWRYLQNVTVSGSARQQPVAAALAIAERNLRGRGACRVHGGGFAGAVQAFVPFDMLDEFIEKTEKMLGEGVCRKAYIRNIGAAVIAI